MKTEVKSTNFGGWIQPTRGSWRRGSESNRRIKVLQTSPLPLGYRAPAHTLAFRPKKVHLGRHARNQGILERETGVEPATSTLARSRSTTELLPLDVSHYKQRDNVAAMTPRPHRT